MSILISVVNIGKQILVEMIYSLSKAYFNKEFWDRVEQYVNELMDADMSGDEKRQKVRDLIWEEWSNVKTTAIDTVIQLVLFKIEPLK
jgi:lipopolysaccharide biosynthesis regulator YciM